MAALVLDGVTKAFRDGTVAVDHLDLAIPDGALCVLVGPSGSGKTTVLRLISGLERADEGRIYLDGRDVSDDSPRDRDVAMVFQNYALYPHLDVYENIAFGLKNRRVPKDEVRRRVRSTGEMLGLSDVMKKRPRGLSGGQRQRVALGRAIVRDPEVFLMDEPLSNLDASLRDQMRTEILRIQGALRVTTVYVTHDQAEAMTLGDVVGVMDEGRLRQLATPQELYARPADLFVAAFMGMPPMNLVEATLELVGDGVQARFGPYELELGDRPIGIAQGRRQAILGIRPEHIVEASGRSHDGTTMEVTVDRRETLGADALLRFSVGAPLLLVRDPREAGDAPAATPDVWAAERPNSFAARVDAATTTRDGDQVRLAVDVTRVHLFDAETGAALR